MKASAMSVQPIVYVVDDDVAVRKSLCFLMTSVSLPVLVFSSAHEFLEAYQPNRPGCLLLDIRMPGMSGLELQKELTARSSELPIIIITGIGNTEVAVRAMKGGAFDFVEKPINNQLLLDKIQKAVEDSKRLWEERTQQAEIQRRLDLLTPRECEVLNLIVAGEKNKWIANHLGISERTVEVHRARVMEKMQAKSLAELIRMVINTERHTGKP